MKHRTVMVVLLVQFAAALVCAFFVFRLDYLWNRGLVSTKLSDFDVMINGPLTDSETERLLVRDNVLFGVSVMEIIHDRVKTENGIIKLPNIWLNLTNEQDHLSWLGYSVRTEGAGGLLIDWETAHLLSVKQGDTITVEIPVKGQTLTLQKEVAAVFPPKSLPGNIVIQDNEAVRWLLERGVLYSRLLMRSSNPAELSQLLRGEFKEHNIASKDELVMRHQEALTRYLVSKDGGILLAMLVVFTGLTIYQAIILHKSASNIYFLVGASSAGALAMVALNRLLFGVYTYDTLAIAFGWLVHAGGCGCSGAFMAGRDWPKKTSISEVSQVKAGTEA